MPQSRPPKPAAPSRANRIALVDDGSLVSQALVQALTSAGFDIEGVLSGDHSRVEDRAREYAAVLVNAALSGVDALNLCTTLRERGCLGAIVAVGNVPDPKARLAALRAGADDYLECAAGVDPLVECVLARVEGCRVRSKSHLYPATAEFSFDAGTLKVSLVPTLVAWNGRPLSFSRIEERLLASLWTARGAVVAPTELVANAWLGQRAPERALQVNLSKLRAKLAEIGLVLEHFRGRGYRLIPRAGSMSAQSARA